MLAMTASMLANLLFLQDLTPRAGTKAEAERVLADTVAEATGTAKAPAGTGAAAGPAVEAPGAVDADTVRAIQRELGQRGYEPGAADGRLGMVTRAAIMAYEADYGLPLTAEPSDALLRHIVLASATRPPQSSMPPQKAASPAAEQLLRTVQQALAGLGYFAARVDGRPGETTTRAIREYEMDHRMAQTGRISAQLLTRLAQAALDGRKAPR